MHGIPIGPVTNATFHGPVVLVSHPDSYKSQLSVQYHLVLLPAAEAAGVEAEAGAFPPDLASTFFGTNLHRCAILLAWQ